MVYLDGAATGRLLPTAKDAMIKTMNLELGNASALHSAGQRAKNLIEDARCEVAKIINANPAEIFFTSGGTEGNNTVIRTFAEKNIAISAIEHPSVFEPAKKYAKNLEIIPVNQWGEIEPKNLKTFDLCSVMLANNELGTIEPLETLRKNLPNFSYLHSDLTQAVGKIEIDVKKLGLTYATFSAHKIGGPVGIGAMYVKESAPLTPLLLGGHQENGQRAGTYPTVQIAGFGAAAKFVNEQKTWEIYDKKVRKLRDNLAKRILAEIPFSSLNTNLEKSLSNILNASFAAAEGESIQLYLDLQGEIMVSTGSACAAGDIKPSRVLMAAKNDAEIAHSSIRFALDLDTTEKDIDDLMKILPKIIKNLQAISTIALKGEK